MGKPTGRILVDAVFFQYNRSGIARVWLSLLREWAADGFGNQLLLLDRQGTAPDIPGIERRVIPNHNYAAIDEDRRLLQTVCDQEGATLLISSYYTAPLTTPSVLMVYDMIPEVIGWDLKANAMWVQKYVGIEHACAYIAISQNTARDLCRFVPRIRADSVAVAHCGVSFQAPSLTTQTSFREKYAIERPYFLMVGHRALYKNGDLFFRAFASLGERRREFAIVCTGPWETLEPEFATHVGEASLHMIEVSDDELQCAYAGALALVYPSRYEGFGMPIVEAMACGCPVITCAAGSIPEVAGDAALYVDPDDVTGMARALAEIETSDVRDPLIERGLRRSNAFTWKRMASEVRQALMSVASLLGGRSSPTPSQTTIRGGGGENALSRIIPGEIVNDDFYKVLEQLALRPDLKTFLEIGSSSGGGSTQAFVSAIAQRSDVDSVKMFCMELSRERFAKLAATYAAYPFVRCYNQSSVRLEEFPVEESVAFFYTNTKTTLNQYPLEQVLGWLRQDLDYMRGSGLTANGIEVIKQENDIKAFDMVLIDGSEFTGEAELFHTIGARVIAMDDVNSHKCFNAYRMLSAHVSYSLLVQDLAVRNGYAVFARRF